MMNYYARLAKLLGADSVQFENIKGNGVRINYGRKVGEIMVKWYEVKRRLVAGTHTVEDVRALWLAGWYVQPDGTFMQGIDGGSSPAASVAAVINSELPQGHVLFYVDEEIGHLALGVDELTGRLKDHRIRAGVRAPDDDELGRRIGTQVYHVGVPEHIQAAATPVYQPACAAGYAGNDPYPTGIPAYPPTVERADPVALGVQYFETPDTLPDAAVDPIVEVVEPVIPDCVQPVSEVRPDATIPDNMLDGVSPAVRSLLDMCGWSPTNQGVAGCHIELVTGVAVASADTRKLIDVEVEAIVTAGTNVPGTALVAPSSACVISGQLGRRKPAMLLPPMIAELIHAAGAENSSLFIQRDLGQVRMLSQRFTSGLEEPALLIVNNEASPVKVLVTASAIDPIVGTVKRSKKVEDLPQAEPTVEPDLPFTPDVPKDVEKTAKAPVQLPPAATAPMPTVLATQDQVPEDAPVIPALAQDEEMNLIRELYALTKSYADPKVGAVYIVQHNGEKYAVGGSRAVVVVRKTTAGVDGSALTFDEAGALQVIPPPNDNLAAAINILLNERNERFYEVLAGREYRAGDTILEPVETVAALAMLVLTVIDPVTEETRYIGLQKKLVDRFKLGRTWYARGITLGSIDRDGGGPLLCCPVKIPLPDGYVVLQPVNFIEK